MTTPTYGIVIQETLTGLLPVQPGDFSVIGILTTADDSQVATFPLNTPVAFNSTDPAYLSAAGTGALANALESINQQLAAWESAATVVAVVVTAGSSEAATITNLLGSQASWTGLYAFASAGAVTGFIPRILIVPGHTGYQAFSITAPVVTAGGSGYTGGATVSFSPAGATATATVVSGAVTAVTMTSPGAYAPGTTVTGTINGTSGGTGATFTFSKTQLANPICAALPSVAAGLLAVAIVGSSGDGVIADTIAWRQTLASDRLIPSDAWVINESLQTPATFTGSISGTTLTVSGTVTGTIVAGAALTGGTVAAGTTIVSGSGTTWTVSGSQTVASAPLTATPPTTVYTDGVAEAAGAQAAVDFQHAGVPGWTISGHQIGGILGLKNTYSFSLTDGSTQGQQLLADQVAVIEPGAIASDTAIASSGYVWAGVWNASTSPLAWFVNKRRMKDYVNLALVKAIRQRLGVDNVTPHAVQAVLNDMTVLGSWLLSKQISLGFAVSFVPSQNSPAQLAQGQFVVTFANETPAPITQVTVESQDYPEALTVELATIIAAANTLSPQYLTS